MTGGVQQDPPEPASARSAQASARSRWIRPLLAALLVLALAAGGYVVAAVTAPIPQPTSRLIEAEQRVSADATVAEAAIAAEALPTAVGWLDGEEVWSNTDAALPLASISKIVTALVCLEASPIAPGEQGSTHIWSEADQQRQNDYIAQDGIAYPIPVGTEVTERQMLTLALLPSANDFAAAYAYSVFGSQEAFIASVEEWKAEHGLDSLVLFEPTGMDERNVASPADTVRIGRLALENSMVAELVSTRTAELPWGIGEVQNTNPLFTRLPGMIGIKTGTSSVAGYNLLAAQRTDAADRGVVKIVVTLGRPSAEQRVDASRSVLLALDAAPQTLDIVTGTERVGTVTTVDGAEIPLLTDGSASAVLLPGEQASRTIELSTIPGTAQAGRRVGTIRVETPLGDEEVGVITATPITEPDLWWRLTHPVELLGW